MKVIVDDPFSCNLKLFIIVFFRRDDIALQTITKLQYFLFT